MSDKHSQNSIHIVAVDNGYVLWPRSPFETGRMELAQWVARDLDELAQLVRRLMVKRPEVRGGEKSQA